MCTMSIISIKWHTHTLTHSYRRLWFIFISKYKILNSLDPNKLIVFDFKPKLMSPEIVFALVFKQLVLCLAGITQFSSSISCWKENWDAAKPGSSRTWEKCYHKNSHSTSSKKPLVVHFKIKHYLVWSNHSLTKKASKVEYVVNMSE